MSGTEDERAAMRIQHCVRAFLARRTRARLQVARTASFQATCRSDLEQSAAITLQAAQRRAAARRRVDQRRESAVQRVPSPARGKSPPPLLESSTHDSVMFFNTSRSYEALTTAFALSSVASFAKLQRDHPDVAKGVLGFEIGGPHGLLHECAALVLQCKWRVHMARVQFKKKRMIKNNAFHSVCDTELAEVGAITIQRVFRGHRARAHALQAPLSAVRAAMKLQRAFRCYKARELRRELSEERRRRFDEEIAASREHEAAVMIQTNLRRHRVQKSKTAAVPATYPRKLRLAVQEVSVVGDGDGRGLSILFDVSQSELMDSRVPRLCWGVRILHAVAVDIALDPDDPRQSRLPSLEVTRWVQGPLGSVLPMTRSVTRR